MESLHSCIRIRLPKPDPTISFRVQLKDPRLRPNLRFYGSHGSTAGAGIDVEVAVSGQKRSLTPISFHTLALRGPIIGVPQAAVHPHGLALWEWCSNCFVVVVHSDRNIVYQEFEQIIKVQLINFMWFKSLISCRNIHWCGQCRLPC
ncbi:hypothetical protein ACS0TY_024080 [Phlomoides rotata]